MKWTVLAVGRLRPPFVDDAQHYMRLLARHAKVEVVEVAEGATVARRLPREAVIVLLDAGGQEHDSEAFARWLERHRQGGRDVCFVVGGPYGIALDGRVDHRLSFGPMTLPHQLARVVLLEQLYRGHKILAGEPYHH